MHYILYIHLHKDLTDLNYWYSRFFKLKFKVTEYVDNLGFKANKKTILSFESSHNYICVLKNNFMCCIFFIKQGQHYLSKQIETKNTLQR